MRLKTWNMKFKKIVLKEIAWYLLSGLFIVEDVGLVGTFKHNAGIRKHFVNLTKKKT